MKKKNKKRGKPYYLNGYVVLIAFNRHRFVSLAQPKSEGSPVAFDNFDVRTAFWIYDPAILTPKQREKIGLIAWKKVHAGVRSDDRG